MGSVDFGAIGFSGTLRPSQEAAKSVIQSQLNEGADRLYIVAPPGSGKTILGLYVWADMIRKPALVLSQILRFRLNGFQERHCLIWMGKKTS